MAERNDDRSVLGAEPPRVSPAGVPAVPLRPDQLAEFRLGRLLILLDVVPGLPYDKPLDVERLGLYDFLADNPFLMFGEDAPQRRTLLLSGFNSRNLSYQSAAQRFANRRARLQHDLSLLLARDTVMARQRERRITYLPTEQGRQLAGELRSLYARAYRTSVELVARELNRLSDTALQREARRWLRADTLLIDLYDTEPSS